MLGWSHGTDPTECTTWVSMWLHAPLGAEPLVDGSKSVMVCLAVNSTRALTVFEAGFLWVETPHVSVVFS